ncbi:colicin transporter [Flavimobilis sp. GY10621]|uniref:Colicin transporter n=2 Tax=Flavimobilis rhizosphaerae TaxID=2775421 RepID=A0ABR9DRC2_9MICO|nr:colicin transporter [Flavimobilis rhizosphaerae]
MTPRRSRAVEEQRALRGVQESTLMRRSDAEILAAQLSQDPVDRFLHAHFAALRAAGAVLAAVVPPRGRGRDRSAWEQLADRVPELAGWAAVFADAARVRAAVEGGRVDLVDDVRADRALEDAEDFRDAIDALVEDTTGDTAGGARALRAVRAS